MFEKIQFIRVCHKTLCSPFCTRVQNGAPIVNYHSISSSFLLSSQKNVFFIENMMKEETQT